MKNVLLLFLLISTSATGQNIITNPNFSVHTLCPSTGGQLDRCLGWYQPTRATPDYYNSCDTGVWTSVPNNLFGQQSSADNAYAGGYIYMDDGSQYREYIATTFPQLMRGVRYRVTITTSLADRSAYAVNGLGVLFYIFNDTSGHITGPIARRPQIDYSGYGTIRDSVNWTTLTSTFVPDSSYDHLIIGSFKSDSALVIDTLDGASGVGYAYYYYDSVAVEVDHSTIVESAPLPVVAHVVPNPFSDHCVLQVENIGSGPYDLMLMDCTGRLVRKTLGLTGNEVVIKRDDLLAGCYFYYLQGNAGIVYRGKLMVQ